MILHGCLSNLKKILFKNITRLWTSFKNSKLQIIKAITCLTAILIFLLYNINFIPSKGIACFEEEIHGGIPDILDDENNIPPKGKSIFFHETSCNNDIGKVIKINSRQACAVESAAKLNPNSTVYLLYTSPVTYPNVSTFSSSEYSILREILKYKNIKIRRVKLKTYVENTPLKEWFYSGELNRSSYVNSHASDVLRFLSLWKYGGTYMDLDVVVMKNLQELKPNFAGAENNNNVAVGVLNFDYDKIGRHFANLCLKELATSFRGDDWGYNGPGVLTRVLNRVCNTKKTSKMTEQRCKGFNVLPPSAVYPIYWKDWRLYFDPKQLNTALQKVHNSYAIHVWNKFSYDTKVFTNDYEVAYGLIAKKFCPNVYRASGDIF